MEACLGVEREVVKVLDKFTNLRDQNVRNIDELLTIVRNAKTELHNASTISSLNDPAIIHAQAAEPVVVNIGNGNNMNSPNVTSVSTQPPVTPSQLNPAQTV